MSRSCCSAEASLSRTKPSGNGVGNSVRGMPTSCDAVVCNQGTSGIWMRCFSRLTVAARKQWHVGSQTRGIFGPHSAPTDPPVSSQSPLMSPHSGSSSFLVRVSRLSPISPMGSLAVRVLSPVAQCIPIKSGRCLSSHSFVRRCQRVVPFTLKTCHQQQR
jgi:hypothetical protein